MTPQEKLTALEDMGKMPKTFDWNFYKLRIPTKKHKKRSN